MTGLMLPQTERKNETSNKNEMASLSADSRLFLDEIWSASTRHYYLVRIAK